jgi:hypothetical protein
MISRCAITFAGHLQPNGYYLPEPSVSDAAQSRFAAHPRLGPRGVRPPLAILVLVPVFDGYVYPTLKRIGTYLLCSPRILFSTCGGVVDAMTRPMHGDGDDDGCYVGKPWWSLVDEFPSLLVFRVVLCMVVCMHVCTLRSSNSIGTCLCCLSYVVCRTSSMSCYVVWQVVR